MDSITKLIAYFENFQEKRHTTAVFYDLEKIYDMV